jgi:hypothetical protein
MNQAAKSPRTWVALATALALHALLLTLPLTSPSPPARTRSIELELTTFLPTPQIAPGPVAEPAPAVEPPPVPEGRLAEAIPPTPLPTPAVPDARQQPAAHRQSRANTAVILSRQYISEEPVIDRLFGRPLETAAAPQVDFRIPQRTGMLSMLDRPMQDLPFEYTPGLVHFAYAPGVRGDLQRFFDVITPEFGWRTDNGTEFRCVLMLVVIGCGWK